MNNSRAGVGLHQKRWSRRHEIKGNADDNYHGPYHHDLLDIELISFHPAINKSKQRTDDAKDAQSDFAGLKDFNQDENPAPKADEQNDQRK